MKKKLLIYCALMLTATITGKYLVQESLTAELIPPRDGIMKQL